MGRIITKQDIIEDNIQDFVERSTSQYTTLLETTPVFGTYYHQNRVFTTNDIGLENVEDDLGRDSPIKFEKIENFPFYNSDSFSLNIERGDIGIDTNYEGELLILPNTIKPYPNDYFTLQSVGEKYFFKVTECQEDLIKSKPFYKINFRFSKIIDESSIREIEEQVIENYTTVYDNIGTDENCIVKTSVFMSLDYMKKLSKNLISVFTKYYYDKANNVFVTMSQDTKAQGIYSQYLNKFIIDNELLNDRRDFYSSIKILEYLPTDYNFEDDYEKTLYYALESQKTKQFNCRYFTYMPITYPHTPWVRSNINYKSLFMLSDVEDGDFGEMYPRSRIGSESIFEFISKEFYGRIKLNNKFDDESTYYIENMIIDYINNNLELPDKETLDRINSTIWRKNIRSYVFIPIILFIFKKCSHYEIKQLN